MCLGFHCNDLTGRPEHLHTAPPLAPHRGGGGCKQWCSPAPSDPGKFLQSRKVPVAPQPSLYNLSHLLQKVSLYRRPLCRLYILGTFGKLVVAEQVLMVCGSLACQAEWWGDQVHIVTPCCSCLLPLLEAKGWVILQIGQSPHIELCPSY